MTRASRLSKDRGWHLSPPAYRNVTDDRNRGNPTPAHADVTRGMHRGKHVIPANSLVEARRPDNTKGAMPHSASRMVAPSVNPPPNVQRPIKSPGDSLGRNSARQSGTPDEAVLPRLRMLL
jgi:hypothetical protein